EGGGPAGQLAHRELLADVRAPPGYAGARPCLPASAPGIRGRGSYRRRRVCQDTGDEKSSGGTVAAESRFQGSGATGGSSARVGEHGRTSRPWHPEPTLEQITRPRRGPALSRVDGVERRQGDRPEDEHRQPR